MKKLKKFYEKTGNKVSFRCEVLDWHKPSDKIGFDGCSFTSVCKRCGRELLQDSQGNWFSFDEAPIIKKVKE